MIELTRVFPVHYSLYIIMTYTVSKGYFDILYTLSGNLIIHGSTGE